MTELFGALSSVLQDQSSKMMLEGVLGVFENLGFEVSNTLKEEVLFTAPQSAIYRNIANDSFARDVALFIKP